VKRPSTEVAFTPSVKALQERHGSRRAYARLEEKGGFPSRVTAELAAFIAERDSLYFATASSDGQPYVQHRGGPKGFLRVLDERTLGFDDLEGNRQYLTLGNLAENPKAFIFLMDYAHQRRVKIWGTARVEERGGSRRILFSVAAWDVNCPKHIPRKYDAAEVEALLAAQRVQGAGAPGSSP
jgi:predicted pyridoxine 5'-phosphate oxidase superfamily flavin-nucleotide-binding protein